MDIYIVNDLKRVLNEVANIFLNSEIQGEYDVSQTKENTNNDVKAYSKLVLKIVVRIDFTRI